MKEEQILHIIEEQPPQLTTIKGSQIVTNGDRRKVHGVCVGDLMNLAEKLRKENRNSHKLCVCAFTRMCPDKGTITGAN